MGGPGEKAEEARLKVKLAAEKKLSGDQAAQEHEDADQAAEEPKESEKLATAPLNVMVSVENPSYSFRLGKRGHITIESHKAACAQVWAKEEITEKLVQVHLNSESGGGMCEIPASCLVRSDGLKNAQPLQNYCRKGKKFKQHVMMRAGISDAFATDIEIMTPKLLMPNEDHLSLYFAHLSWAIENKDPREFNSVAFVPAQLSRTFLELLALPEKNEEQQVCLCRCRQLGERLMLQNQVILVPIWSPGKQIHHFTLLVLSKSDESFSVRYYDSLKTAKAGARDRAQELLRNLFGMVEDVPERCNKSFQLNVECAFHVMHHMEDEMRHMLGQGWGTQGWTDQQRMANLRQTMISVTATLEQERVKWRLDLEKAEQQSKELAEKAEKAQAQLQKSQEAAARAAQSSQALALKSMMKGQSELIVSVPDDFALPQAKAKAKAKAKPEEKGEEENKLEEKEKPEEEPEKQPEEQPEKKKAEEQPEKKKKPEEELEKQPEASF